MTNNLIESEVISIAASDGYPLACRVWNKSAYDRPMILCLHGIQSHSGWYESSSARFASAGYRVVFPDRRGSGMNEDQRGDMLSYSMLSDDIRSVLTYFSCPMRVILLAISWGAKPAAWIAFNDYPWLEKCIFITPGWFPQVDMGFGDKSKVAKSLFYNQGDDMIPIPIPGSDYFTKSPQWRKFIDNDPTTLHTCTARFFYETRKLDAAWQAKYNRFDKPSLLMLAEDDRIIYNDKAEQFFKAHFPHHTSKKVMYSGCEHTLEFDQTDLRFVDDIIQWLR